MSNLEKESNGRYITVFDEQTKQFTRTDTSTGRTWSWYGRNRPTAPKYYAKNGITIEKLQAAGNSVRIKHLRWALYLPQFDVRGHNRRPLGRAIVVPSSFRSDPMYVFLPKGGYTHIVIKHKTGNYICVSSECAEDDSFCYAAGVATALDRLTPTEIKLLTQL